MEYEVTAVEKPYGALGHDSITAIGNNRDGWSISSVGAIRRIILKRDAFYILDPVSEQKVYLTIAKDRTGKVMLRTFAENRPSNHLLALRPLRDTNLVD